LKLLTESQGIIKNIEHCPHCRLPKNGSDTITARGGNKFEKILVR
jgi:hypothetical protein